MTRKAGPKSSLDDSFEYESNSLKIKATMKNGLAVAVLVTSSNIAGTIPAATALTSSPYFRKPTAPSQKKRRISSPKSSVLSPVLSSHSTPARCSSSDFVDHTSSTKKDSKNDKNTDSRTTSFEPHWAGSVLVNHKSNTNPTHVHTLILGTHPSIASLSESEYFGHKMNAFWWIVGDALGFRRGTGVSPSSGKAYKFAEHLRYGHDKIIPYDEQMQLLTSKGFALWDIVQSCERKGSLDSEIKNEQPNDIRGFCHAHPTIKSIVIANGGTGCTMFLRHFKDWWETGELVPGDNDHSQQAFKRYINHDESKGRIKCVSAVSVSPAAASFSYETKREIWEKHCFTPGLQYHEEMQLEYEQKEKCKKR